MKNIDRKVVLSFSCPQCGTKNKIKTTLADYDMNGREFDFYFDWDEVVCKCGAKIAIYTDENSPANYVIVK